MSKVDELRRQLAEAEEEEQREQNKKRDKWQKDHDEFVNSTVEWAVQMSMILSSTKKEIFESGFKLQEQLYDVFDRKPKEGQKVFTFQTKDKTRKIVIEHSERMVFNDSANVGLELMHEVLKDKYESRNKGMYKIIDQLLTRNAKGDYDPKLLVKLRKLESEINEPQFSKALQILTEAQEVDNTSLYVRIYQREKITGKWKDIILQFSAL